MGGRADRGWCPRKDRVRGLIQTRRGKGPARAGQRGGQENKGSVFLGTGLGSTCSPAPARCWTQPEIHDVAGEVGVGRQQCDLAVSRVCTASRLWREAIPPVCGRACPGIKATPGTSPVHPRALRGGLGCSSLTASRRGRRGRAQGRGCRLTPSGARQVCHRCGEVGSPCHLRPRQSPPLIADRGASFRCELFPPLAE